jgi:hypothetical protein
VPLPGVEGVTGVEGVVGVVGVMVELPVDGVVSVEGIDPVEGVDPVEPEGGNTGVVSVVVEGGVVPMPAILPSVFQRPKTKKPITRMAATASRITSMLGPVLRSRRVEPLLALS